MMPFLSIYTLFPYYSYSLKMTIAGGSTGAEVPQVSVSQSITPTRDVMGHQPGLRHADESDDGGDEQPPVIEPSSVEPCDLAVGTNEWPRHQQARRERTVAA